MVGRFSIDMESARIIAESMPSAQGFIWADRGAIHGDSVGQQTENRKPCYETGPYRGIRLLVPPSLGDLIGRVALNQQREEDVSVRDTRHSGE